MRTVFGKVLRLGEAATFCVGLAVVLAVVLGIASSALAADGKPFVLGRGNVATKVSTLFNKGVGPALGLKVAANQAPLTVNPEAGTATGLSADELDGKSSEDFLASDGKAADAAHADNADNAQTLNGKSSAEFVVKALEPWHEVGAPGEPTFFAHPSTGGFVNYDSQHNSAGFYKDPLGTVHLKGLVKRTNSSTLNVHCSLMNTVFQLPPGYRPATQKTSVFSVPANLTVPSGEVMLRLNIDADGAMYVCDSSGTGKQWKAGNWISLDGISFRAGQ